MLSDIEDGLVPTADLAVHTGDITDGTENTTNNTIETEDSYAKKWLTRAAKGAASLWNIGNHDIRDRTPNTRIAWEAAYGRLGNTYVDVRGWRFVTFSVDSHSSNTAWVVPDETWDWVDSVCADAPGPVVLTEHYPPWELTQSALNYLEPSSKLDSLVAARTNIAGMLCGHMHYDIDGAQMTQILTIGGRRLPVICDISSMLSLNGDSRDQSAQMQSTSVYVEMTESSWRVHYRRHGTRAWGGPLGLRVTTMDLGAGVITHSM